MISQISVLTVRDTLLSLKRNKYLRFLAMEQNNPTRGSKREGGKMHIFVERRNLSASLQYTKALLQYSCRKC